MKYLRFIVERDLLGEFTRPATIYDAEFKLNSAGWSNAGAGVFGKVFAKPNKNYVLKLFKQDLAYRKYLDLITSKENKHFPKLRGLPIKVNDNYSAIRIEKLEPFKGQRGAQAGEIWLQARNYQDNLKVLDKIDSDRMRGTAPGHVGGRYNDKSREDIIKKLDKVSSKYPELADALDLIHKHVYKATGANYDLHDGNIMFRGKTMVITDPVAYGKTSGSKSPIYKDPKQLKLFQQLPNQEVPKLDEPPPERIHWAHHVSQQQQKSINFVQPRPVQPKPVQPWYGVPKPNLKQQPVEKLHWGGKTQLIRNKTDTKALGAFVAAHPITNDSQKRRFELLNRLAGKKKGKRGRPRKIDIERARVLRRQGMKYKDIAKVFHARTAAVWMALNRTPHQKHNLRDIIKK
jgi:hypothetical protein